MDITEYLSGKRINMSIKLLYYIIGSHEWSQEGGRTLPLSKKLFCQLKLYDRRTVWIPRKGYD